MNIVIIKCINNNYKYIINSLNKIGINPNITDNINKIKNSDKLIIYSFYSIKKIIKIIKKKKLYDIIYNLKQPVLGISNGFHILCTNYYKIKCLNIFKNTNIKKIYNLNKKKKYNIGWNKIYHNNDEKIFYKLKNNFIQYFIDYNYVKIGAYCTSHTNNIVSYSSSLKRKNFYGLQFHPEMSGLYGEKILKNFIYLI
ncbi:MAG: imidazole glycerol phosphate synthase subunit HisH [Candidatus Shikimatogenerans bostrichidophilus]|nr:MAG: imidazole glycerol phosphate synthase subunit HisH [Candidatus Shikimatogenerans bostrichidophilus]